jgi:hypothetical protein
VDIVETDILWYVNISSCETLVFPGEWRYTTFTYTTTAL